MAFCSLLVFTWRIFRAKHDEAAARRCRCLLSVPRLSITSLHHTHGDEKARTLLDGTLPAPTFLKEGLAGHKNATGEA